MAATSGLQPWRKVFHAGTGIVVAWALLVPSLSRGQALLGLALAFALLSALDAIRLRRDDANALFFRLFGALASPREARGFASSTWYALGLLLTVALVPRPEAVSAVLVLGLADPIASVVGQRFGRRPLLGGSVEGTLTFLTVALAILVARHAWPAAVPAAVVATLAERRSWPLDDNLAIPLATGLTLLAVGLLV